MKKGIEKKEIIRSRTRRVIGEVVRRSGEKTISVRVTRVTRHKKYGKKVVTSKKYLVHDESNDKAVGQKVTIQESRPLSARKRWTVVEL